MNREHLYRAKRKNWRKSFNKEWIEGYYVKIGDNHFILTAHAANEGFIEDFEIDSDIVCEYTGLQDKDGTKIFEGDIVRRIDLHNVKEPSAGFIEYDTENTSFLIHWVDIQNYSATFPWKDRIKVIGNVFDNPELLKGGNGE